MNGAAHTLHKLKNSISILNLCKHAAIAPPAPLPESELEEKLFTILVLQLQLAADSAKTSNSLVGVEFQSNRNPKLQNIIAVISPR